MVGPRVCRLGAMLFAVCAVGVLFSSGTRAIEAFDGRLQVHGFGEMQIRGINRDFSEQLDLAQWYNIFNAEFEIDFAPDGLGPIDLFQAYIRIEARFDCVWSRGCGMFESANTYGNRAKRLPDRLADAIDPDYSGTLPPAPGNGGLPRHPRPEPAGFEPFRDTDTDGNGGPIIKDSGFPGFDLLFRQNGADTFIDTGDEQARYTFGNVLDFRFGLLKIRDQDAGGTTTVGPWLPSNTIGDPRVSSALAGNGMLRDRANPYRGRFTPSYQLVDEAGRLVRQHGERFHEADRKLTAAELADLKNQFRDDYEDTFESATRLDVLDESVREMLVRTDLIPIAGDTFFLPPGAASPGTPQSGFKASEYVALRTNGSVLYFEETNAIPPLSKIRSSLKPTLDQLFGGDFNPTFPCLDPDPTVVRPRAPQNPNISQIRGDEYGAFCLPDGVANPDFIIEQGPPGVISSDKSEKIFPAGFGSNRRVSGGGGELPFRPAPDIGLFGSIRPGPDGKLGTADDVPELDENTSLTLAQGLYYPNVGVIRELESGRLDNPDVNFTEYERAFNRGQSQQDQGELKEAYLDLEFLDSRLWVRVGLQNIVWGKTELFRTTDQFNPQDLALSSLPSLEESRIAMWSGRFVYSLYDVWEFEDVRLEFAFNLDQYQPADLGACGEPYTINIACGVPFGLLANNLLGVGLVGVDRPDNPWDNFKGLEFGGRIEWRWSRFSFAITDFLGYSDFPYIDVVFDYDRNVDPTSGRARFAENYVPGSCGTNDAFNNDQTRLLGLPDSIEGVGTAPGCLKPGGDAGEANANGLGIDSGTGKLRFGVDPTASPENALYYHQANQQIFATLCSATVSISARLDPTACAFNIFASRAPLTSILSVPLPLSEVFAVFLSGEPSSGQGNLNRTLGAAATGSTVQVVPLVNLNRESGFGGRGFNPRTASNADSYRKIADAGSEDFRNVLTLDSTLTREQRALLGCGPFWGTRCDSSANQFNPEPPGDIVYKFEGGGGMDFLNAEASVLLQSWPGVEGTGTVGLNGFEEGMGWSTIGRTLRQPGTIGFDGGPVATRYLPGLDFEGESAPGISGVVGDRHSVADANGIVRLPGSRGVATPYDLETFGLGRGVAPFSVDSTPGSETITFIMQEGYNPIIDGCMLSSTMTDGSTGTTYEVVGVMPHKASGTLVPLARSVSTYCGPRDPTFFNIGSTSRFGDQLRSDPGEAPVDPDTGVAAPVFIDDVGSASTLYHPMAGCLLTEKEASDLANAANASDPGAAIPYAIDRHYPCSRPNANLGDSGKNQNGVNQNRLIKFALPDLPGYEAGDSLWEYDAKNGTDLASVCGLFTESGGRRITCGRRDHDTEFIQSALAGVDGRTQIFQSELAAVSWNLLQLLVVTSCNEVDDDKLTDPDCFDPNERDGVDRTFRTDGCSLAAPHFCRNVKGFLGIGGVSAPYIKAGGNGRFGRRTFAWHGGQQAVLRYNRRNVLGFSMDFAEDVSKSNWGMEFTWIEGQPFSDASQADHITRSDTINLTVSIDRPTFINFMNANRTFFFNTQWFFQYQTNHNDRFLANGPFNVLFTFAMFTGYFQDRLLPTLVTVYDFNSQSGGILPSITYRFTDVFSVDWGFLLFFGRTQLKDMDIRPIGPPVNRAGANAYKQPVDNLLSLVRARDEVYVRLRYTF